MNIRTLKIPVSFKTGLTLYPIVKQMIGSVLKENPALAGVTLSSLLAATQTNTINNGAFTQEWQFPMLTGGSGFKITANRAAITSTTAERLLTLELSGSVAAGIKSRPMNVLRMDVTMEGAPTALKFLEMNFVGSGLIAVPAQPNSSSSSFIRMTTDNAGIIAMHYTGVNQTLKLGGASMIQSVGNHVFSQHASGIITVPMFDLFGGAGAPVVNITSSIHHAITIPSTAADLINAYRGNVAIQTVSNTNKLAALSIRGSKLISASLNIETGIAPTNPTDGDFWIESDHFFCRLAGISLQIDQQAGAVFYNGDGILSNARIVDMNSNSLTFSNAGLFRIQDTGPDAGIYDFNEGVDFMIANTDKSYSFTKELVTGIRLTAVDILNTITRRLAIDINGITLDSAIIKLQNLPVYADDTAAGVGGLTTTCLYKTATGEVRIKV